MLAAADRASTYDIGERFWVDVDDSRSYVKAEVALAEAGEYEPLVTARHTVIA